MTSLSVHHVRALYWLQQHDDTTVLGKASLDGSNMSLIHSETFTSSGLTIDLDKQVLYWQNNSKIWSFNITSESILWRVNGRYSATNMKFFEDNLYIASMNDPVQVVDISSGTRMYLSIRDRYFYHYYYIYCNIMLSGPLEIISSARQQQGKPLKRAN